MAAHKADWYETYPGIDRLGLPVGVYNTADQYNRTDVGLTEANTARSIASVAMNLLGNNTRWTNWRPKFAWLVKLPRTMGTPLIPKE